jgi:hypothetical protein
MSYTKRAFVIILICLFAGNTFGKVSAIVERWDTHYKVSSNNNLSKVEFIRMKVLDSDGYKKAVYSTYYDKFRKLKGLTYTIFDASNKKVKRLTKADALDVMLNSSNSIDDSRVVVLDPNYQSYPFTVEIEAEMAYDGFIGFEPWMPRSEPDLEIKHATLLFECPLNYEFRTMEENGIAAPSFSKAGEQQALKWQVKDLPAVSAFENNKLFFSSQPVVRIAPVSFSYGNTSGSFKTWSDFGAWYQQINEGRNEISDQTKMQLNKIKEKNKDNVQGIVKDVYKFMQSRTRYISIQLGIGGFQSIPADVVDKNGYGDCKALTNYMKAMLAHLKVPSNYVLVKAGDDETDVIRDFPMNEFNHVFLSVPVAKDTLWLECTSQISPPFYTGTFTDDRNVLWVDGKNSKLIRTPAFKSYESVVHRNAAFLVDAEGDATSKIKMEKTGMFFDDFIMYEHRKKDDIERINYSRFYYKDYNIKNWSYKIPDTAVSLLNEDFDLSIIRLGQVVQDKLIISYNPLTPLEKNFEMDITNKIVEVSRAFTIEDNIELVVPEEFHSDFIPAAFSEKSPFGEVIMSINTNEAKNIVIYKKAIINKGLYKAESFDKFNAFVKKIRQVEQSKIVYKRKT